MPDRELRKFPRGRGGLRFGFLDKPPHALLQTTNHLIHFRFRSFHNQLHPAIRKIAHVSMHIILQGYILGRVAKTNALHPAAVVNNPP